MTCSGACAKHLIARTGAWYKHLYNGRADGSPHIEIRTFLQVASKSRGCAVKKMTKLRRDVVSPFRDKLWNLFKETAKGMDGADVVVALKQAGEEIWAVGIDDTYSSMSHQDDEPLGNAFDITWLTVVCIKLKEMQQGKKPKVRIHT